MTQLRKQMLEELQRRNYSQTTVKGYTKIVEKVPEIAGVNVVLAAESKCIFPGSDNVFCPDF